MNEGMNTGAGDDRHVNGIARPAEIHVVRVAGQWLIGRLEYRPPPVHERLGVEAPVMSPVFELHMRVQEAPDGRGIVIAYSAQPMLMIAAIDRYTLTPADVVNLWPIARFGTRASAQLRDAFARAEENARTLRAHQAGIAVATSMPIPGGRH